MLASPSVQLAGERLAAPVAAAGLCFCAMFFSGGFADAPLVWIGGLALLAAAAAAAVSLVGVIAPVRPTRPAAAFLGCLFGLAVWTGLSTLWSLSPDASWSYTNRTLVYAAFALLGVLLSGVLPRTRMVAAAAATLIGAVLGWALLARCVPSLYPDYGRVARLRSPLGYWNELALLCVVAVPLALWIAAPAGRRAWTRASGVLLLFVATTALLLTYSRVGVVLACVAAAAWVALDRNRVESLTAVALGGGVGAAAFGIALALPGITADGQTRASRVHDGWIFALVLLAGGALVVAVAGLLARLEERKPLGAVTRRSVERVALAASVALVAVGIAASVVFSNRIWSEFTNPVSSQIGQSSGRLTSLNSSNRWRWWGEEWDAFTAHPLLGTGAGTFKLTDLRVRSTSLVTTDEPHNTPLQFLGELGIVGLLLYLGAAVAAALAVLGARRRAAGDDRAAVTALGLGLAAFVAHTVVDMDWNFVATCGPLLLVAGVLAGRSGEPASGPVAVRRPLLAVAAVLFAAGAVYSLAAPWLAQRDLLTLSVASAKHAHAWDPLSTEALIDQAALTADPLRAEPLYRQAVSLEPENSETWYELGTFYGDYGDWKRAYDALSKAWTYDKYGPAGLPCGALDQARHKVLGTWPPSCPRGRPRAATP
jgi:hypothetical protein